MRPLLAILIACLIGLSGPGSLAILTGADGAARTGTGSGHPTDHALVTPTAADGAAILPSGESLLPLLGRQPAGSPASILILPPLGVLRATGYVVTCAAIIATAIAIHMRRVHLPRRRLAPAAPSAPISAAA